MCAVKWISRVKQLAYRSGLAAFVTCGLAIVMADQELAAQTVDTGYELSRIDLNPLGIRSPDGLVYLSDRDALLITEEPARDDEATQAALISLSGDFEGWYELNLLSGTASSIDGSAGILLDDEKLKALGRAHTTLSGLEGSTIDPATGSQYFLDASAFRLLQRKTSGAWSVINFQGVATQVFSGLAYHPGTRLLYTLSEDKRTLYGFSTTGGHVVEIKLSSADLRSPQGMTFAPSLDSSDDPRVLSLFIADAGDASSTPVISEFSIQSGEPVLSSAGPEVISFGTSVPSSPTTSTSSFSSTTLSSTSDSELQLVNVIDMSRLSPPSPDTSGITYIPSSGRLFVTDSEVNETDLFEDANLFTLTLGGSLLVTGDTTSFSREPTGASYRASDGMMFISDDSRERIWMVLPGTDGHYGDENDIVTYIRTDDFGSQDPEGVAYDPATGHLFIIDGESREVHRVDPGSNGIFEGDAGDDRVTHFDVHDLGAGDPEGIAVHEGNGTLLIVDNVSGTIIELTKDGDLIHTFEIAHLTTNYVTRFAGIVVAPSSSGSGTSFYVASRGIDNNKERDENDGYVFEFAAGGGGGGVPGGGGDTGGGGDSPPVNQPPMVNAGSDQTVLGTDDAVALGGSASDDGLPDPPANLDVSWSLVSGPDSVIFGDDSNPTTTVRFSSFGTYVLRLSATDSSATVSDDVSIDVLNPDRPTVEEFVIARDDDDVEERPSGSIKFGSSDLELGYDGSDKQYVGLRFTGVTIPAGAEIDYAYVQFETDEVSTSNSVLTIDAQDSGDAPAFSGSDNDVSSRPLTASSVEWTPETWDSRAERGSAQKTPNIRSLIQEIVDHPNWSSGNALVLVIAGTGTRTAEASDGSYAPRLQIAWRPGGPRENRAPLVNAGADQTIGSGTPATLDGTVSDDGLPNPPSSVSTQWSKVSGPGTVVFAASSAVDTTATFSANGTYVLKLRASDGSLQSEDTVTINVAEIVAEPAYGEFPITSSLDDVEERPSGSLRTGSSDLEMTDDRGEDMVIGLRFRNVSIPRGAVIDSAHIQFETDETSSGETILSIRGHDTDNAPEFVKDDYNVSSRPSTASSVTWRPVAWTSKGEQGEKQRTPDLRAIIQEIVNRPGWSSDNALVIVISGSGDRVAESSDGSFGPVLKVNWRAAGAP